MLLAPLLILGCGAILEDPDAATDGAPDLPEPVDSADGTFYDNSLPEADRGWVITEGDSVIGPDLDEAEVVDVPSADADLPACPPVGPRIDGLSQWVCADYPAVGFCESSDIGCNAEPEAEACGPCPNVKLIWRPGGAPVEDTAVCTPCSCGVEP